jgi:hypothetical protein
LAAGLPLTGSWQVAIRSFSPGVWFGAGGLAAADCAAAVAAFNPPPRVSPDNVPQPAIPARALPALFKAVRRVTREGSSLDAHVMRDGIPHSSS